jgi:hypothetical protein
VGLRFLCTCSPLLAAGIWGWVNSSEQLAVSQPCLQTPYMSRAALLTHNSACLLLQVRPELPSPAAGQLPLPRSLPASLQSQLCAPLPSWQQLPWPQGQAPQQPAPTSKAALAFKVSVVVTAGLSVATVSRALLQALWRVVAAAAACVMQTCSCTVLRSRGAFHIHGIESYPCKINSAESPVSGGWVSWGYSCQEAGWAHTQT